MYIPIALKRHNKTEQKVLSLIYEKFSPRLTIYRDLNTKEIIKNRIKRRNPKEYSLFLDAETPNKTPLGNYKKIEFLLIPPNKKYYWIDAKHSNKTTNITDLHGIYYRTNILKDIVFYVVDGKGYSDEVIKEHLDFINNFNLKNIQIIKLSKFKELLNKI